jgi:hypothetical protein
VACAILAIRSVCSLTANSWQAPWRWIYVITAIISLYLNVFVLVAQSFMTFGPKCVGAYTIEPPFAMHKPPYY